MKLKAKYFAFIEFLYLAENEKKEKKIQGMILKHMI